ncbi:MAG TPA: hypothetical protein EYH49_03760 [Aquifex aeolicus]|nr:hypothetical protein [Aquifex aeolicus]
MKEILYYEDGIIVWKDIAEECFRGIVAGRHFKCLPAEEELLQKLLRYLEDELDAYDTVRYHIIGNGELLLELVD